METWDEFIPAFTQPQNLQHLQKAEDGVQVNFMAGGLLLFDASISNLPVLTAF